ncbi:PH domain-containing protein [Brachybacterium aquaticum]|uniref:Putative membrane protein n=1 Tax=Brachybacterium aquaticum TaxID=1432564 RepID=A0A841ACS0_9MICO|nr:PH domain-containing protein [Brachybacterium aquaticum]MBB5831747.1 putative membrane protein [Brachybacterium aquaticum]
MSTSPSLGAETEDVSASTPRHRTHPITPLVSGWKVVVGIVAIITAQNIAQLAAEFTIQRALIGLALLAVVILVVIGGSAFRWWFTTYAVDDDGVSLHKGMISRSREYAPRARIESVSIERPLLPRLLGLAKVRVEVAGGGESYLDIEYIRSSEAEELRRGILGIAAGTGAAAGRSADGPAGGGRAADGPAAGGAAADGQAFLGPTADGSFAPAAAGSASAAHGDRLQELLYDGVTEGELIAQIPTARLIRSLLRDLGFLTGVVSSVLGVIVAIFFAIWQDGFSVAIIIALVPTFIAVPKYVFGRIDAGWGFTSRYTERGLRMRRGLLDSRTDNIAAGRIQRYDLRRPRLWRAPGWTAVSATVAGIDDDDENGAESVLPVGTREELRDTLGHLSPPLGTEDDLATLEHLLMAPARQIPGIRTPRRELWISRRTRVTVVLPGALVHRRGILARRLSVIPRDRIQQLTLNDDVLARRLDVLDLTVQGAGHELELGYLSRADALALHALLAEDARTLRRYRDRDQWPRPALAAAKGPRPIGPLARAPGPVGPLAHAPSLDVPFPPGPVGRPAPSSEETR